MSKAENGRNGLVFPSKDDSYSEELKQHLKDTGFCEADQAWLVQVFERPDCFGNSDTNSDSIFKDGFEDSFEYVLPSILEDLEEQVQTEEDRQIRLAFLFSAMLGFGPRSLSETMQPNTKPVKSDGVWDIPQWADEFRRHAKFCAERLDWNKLKSSIRKLDDLTPFLSPKGVPLDQIVDLDLLEPTQRRSWSHDDSIDPKGLEFWLIWRFEASSERCNTIRLHTLLQKFADFPEDVLGDKILGLLNAIHNAMNISVSSEERLDALNDGWRVVARELIPFLDILNEKQPESNLERSSLIKAWWRLAKVIYSRSMGGLESELSIEFRNRLVESAARHIGMLRAVLRDSPKVFEEKNLAGEVSDFYRKAFDILLNFADPWKCLKPLLLAFTEMNVPAVASDLRSWGEHGKEVPPHPYSQVPYWIGIAMYPQNLRAELDRDPHLQDLREAFAKFCLGRLKTKEDETDFVEPRPIWRQCYVQALTVLRVNPGGRAHRTLFWLSKNDPDEECRRLAKRAHRQIRHINRKKPNLELGASPRRPLFEAFWWLRQAHLVTLGKEIDEAGAMRTRRKELHRTREKDDHLNWKA